MNDLNLTEEQKDVLIRQLIAKNKKLQAQIRRLEDNAAAKKKLEFSKLIFVGVSIFILAITVYSCVVMWITGDLSALGYLISAAGAEMAAATGFYYTKAKTENKIKLMSAYGVKPEATDFNEY